MADDRLSEAHVEKSPNDGGNARKFPEFSILVNISLGRSHNGDPVLFRDGVRFCGRCGR